MGRPVRALRRDHLERIQRQRVHAVGRDGRPGVGQEPRRERARAAPRTCSRARSPPSSTATRFSASTRSTARPNSASPARGQSASLISGWASPPAAARRSSPNTTSRRRHGVAAIEAVLGIAANLTRVIQVSELRTIAADSLWMSPQYGRDTVAIHFTWAPEPDAVRSALVEVERALAPFEARPHWGKLFLADAGTSRPPLRAPRGFPRAARPPRPARRVPQRLAHPPRARRRRLADGDVVSSGSGAA